MLIIADPESETITVECAVQFSTKFIPRKGQNVAIRGARIPPPTTTLVIPPRTRSQPLGSNCRRSVDDYWPLGSLVLPSSECVYVISVPGAGQSIDISGYPFPTIPEPGHNGTHNDRWISTPNCITVNTIGWFPSVDYKEFGEITTGHLETRFWVPRSTG